GQIDVLAFGRRDRAARANDGTDHSALQASKQAAENHTGSGANSGGARLVADTATLEHLGRHGANGIRAAADFHLIERQRQAADPINTTGTLDAGDNA